MFEENQSASSSIDIWLGHHPEQPEDYELEHPQTSKSTRKRKRHNPIGALSTRSHKRRQLMEVSGNSIKLVEQTPDRKLRSSGQRPPPATPTRRSKTVVQRPTTTNPVPSNVTFLQEEEDPERTPTTRPDVLGKIPSLHARPLNPQFKAPPSQGESSDSGESHDSKQPRSRSPTKRLGDFQFSDMPVDPQAWSSDAIPPELKDLITDMEDIGSKVGIIPLEVKDRIAATKEIVRDFQWAKEDGRHRDKEAEEKATDRITGGLGHGLFWYRVSMIHRATIECLVGSDPEPAWNSEVHSSILRLALEGHWEGEEVWYKDITVARISNKSLVPWNIATGAMQSKMVDYAIVINPSQRFIGDPSKLLHNHIIEKLRVENAGASINQTAAEWVRFKPIAVNVETKKGAVGEDEAHVQLGTWLTAQYSRLRQLMPDKAQTKLPSFPVLSVQGQRWLLRIASLQENERIHLIKELYLGDTGSIVGVYQVIAAIRRIARWISEDYRPWFEREILGIKVDVISQP